MTQPPSQGLPFAARLRADVVTASLAVLVRAMKDNNVGDEAAMACLRDAPDKIEAALTRGCGALVIYRLDPDAPRGIVGTADTRLAAFVDEARGAGVPVIGLNPDLVAQLALAMGGDAAAFTENQLKGSNNATCH